MLTPELIEARRGNITASKAHAMMAGWDKPRPVDIFPAAIYEWIAEAKRKPLVKEIKDVLECDVSGASINAAWAAYQFDKPSQGLLTYAEELACDELFEADPLVWDGSTVHMDIGNEREIEAMEKLIEATGLPFDKIGDDQIHVSVDGIGATPDGIVYDDLDLIVTGAEVKCRSPLHHARQLLITDNASLREHDPERYCQIQVQMYVTGADEWYSACFNPCARNVTHRFHYCIIKRDAAFLDVFAKRAQQVFEHKATFLAMLNDTRSKAA